MDKSIRVWEVTPARGGIVRRGLGYDHADVAVITNITADHLGSDGIDGLDDLTGVKALVAEQIERGGSLVLNADDPRAAALAQRAAVRERNPVVRYVSLDGRNPVIVAHRLGTWILGQALIRDPELRFDKVLLVDSVLPRGYPWDRILERGQVQSVRHEIGHDGAWARVLGWFVPGTGTSGTEGFTATHPQLQQERIEPPGARAFDPAHVVERWLPFLTARSGTRPVQSLEVEAPQGQGMRPQVEQPAPNLARTAASRSTPATLANVASQASTSANSASRSLAEPPRRAAASSPTSSMNHMKVPSSPRRLSLAPKVSRISCWTCGRSRAIVHHCPGKPTRCNGWD